jgi:phage shock protein E
MPTAISKATTWLVTATVVVVLLGAAIASAAIASAARQGSVDSVAETIPNDLIDYRGFRSIVDEAEDVRESKRLTESEFLAAMSDENTILLDARSATWFAQRHLVGAVNLPFTDWTEASLAKIIPQKETKILIYCNNNFLGSPTAFATKSAPASLNLVSYTNLVAYGYTDVYELGPLLDVNDTVLPFEGTEVE